MHSDTAKSARLGDYVEAGAIIPELTATHRDEVLRELIEHIPLLKERPDERARLFGALKEREELCSTGVGEGIAFPHSRNALVGLVDRPVIVIGRKAGGLHFGSVDGAPVRLFFLVVAPDVTSHLRTLARLSRLLRNPRLRQNLLAAETVSRILSLIRVNEVDLEKSVTA